MWWSGGRWGERGQGIPGLPKSSGRHFPTPRELRATGPRPAAARPTGVLQMWEPLEFCRCGNCSSERSGCSLGQGGNGTRKQGSGVTLPANSPGLRHQPAERLGLGVANLWWDHRTSPQSDTPTPTPGVHRPRCAHLQVSSGASDSRVTTPGPGNLYTRICFRFWRCRERNGGGSWFAGGGSYLLQSLSRAGARLSPMARSALPGRV